MPLAIRAISLEKPAGALTPAFDVEYKAFPQLVRAFHHVVNTEAAEREVQAWVASGFEATYCLPMLHAIIVVFGIGHRIWGKWSNWYANSPGILNTALRAAHGHALAGRLHDAMDALRPIKGLGSVTYASKTLRFFSPLFPVLDSRIMMDCGYGPRQYRQFADDCSAIASQCPAGTTAVDVEAGLFTAIQVNNPKQRKKAWCALRETYPSLCLHSVGRPGDQAVVG